MTVRRIAEDIVAAAGSRSEIVSIERPSTTRRSAAPTRPSPRSCWAGRRSCRGRRGWSGRSRGSGTRPPPRASYRRRASSADRLRAAASVLDPDPLEPDIRGVAVRVAGRVVRRGPPEHSVQVRVDARTPLARGGRAEEQDGRRAVGRRQVSDAGVAGQRSRAPPMSAARSCRSSRPQRSVTSGCAGHRPAGVALGRRTRHDDRPSLLGDARRHSRPPVRGPAPGAGRSARMDHERRVGQAGERGARRASGGCRRRSTAEQSPPAEVTKRHHRSTSCSSASHSGPSTNPAGSQWNATSSRGASCASARWLCGPMPCRLTATSGAGRPTVGSSGLRPARRGRRGRGQP